MNYACGVEVVAVLALVGWWRAMPPIRLALRRRRQREAYTPTEPR